MKLSIMDCQNGYICRLVESREYEVPKSPELAFQQLVSILQLTLQAKVMLKLNYKKV